MNDCMVEDYIPTLSKEKQQRYADEFCEGDKNLKELLLLLWRSDINTYACCRGHEDNPAYIYFACDNMSNPQLKRFLQGLFGSEYFSPNYENGKYSINITLDNQKYVGNKLAGFEKVEGCYLDRLKTIAVYLPNPFNFSALLYCFKTSLNAKDVSTKYDNQIDLIVRLMDIDLAKQISQDPLDVTGKINISIGKKHTCNVTLLPFIYSCKNSHEIFKNTKYKAFHFFKHEYLYFINNAPNCTYDAKHLKEFKSLKLTRSEIKNYCYRLTEKNVRWIEKQFGK